MKISELQKFVRDAVERDETVVASRAAVVAADDGSPADEVARALAEVDLAVVVLAPKWRPTSNAAKRPVGILSLTVRVAEKPATNRVGDFTTGVDLAEHIACVLNLTRPCPSHDVLVVDDAGISASLGPDHETVVWEVPFKTLHQLSNERN